MPDDRRKKPSSAQDLSEFQWETEYNLIGCLLFKKDFYAEVAGKLKVEYFRFPAHQKVFAEFERRFTAGLPTDGYSIRQSFEDELIADDVRLHDYLDKSGGHARNLGAIGVSQVETLRLSYTLAAAEASARHLRVPGAPDLALQSFFNDVDDVRFDYLRAQGSINTKSIGDAALAFVTDLSARLGKNVKDRRVRTGFHGLDNMLGGFGEGDLVILAGRPGMGKSTLATSIVRGAASQLVDVETEKELKPRYPALLFSLEMPEEQVTARMVAEDIAHHVKGLSWRGPALEYRALLNPKSLGEYEDWERTRQEWGASLYSFVDDAQRRIQALPIKLNCSASLTLGDLAAHARKVKTALQKEGQDLALIVIDYLKQIKASDRYSGNRVLEVGEITSGLKRLAKELGIPIILLCQLNRGVEKRDDKRPTLADLRDSGEIEQDADVVMFTYRQAYYDRNASAASNILEVIIEKNRNGPTGKVELLVDLSRSFVTNPGS
jgi:replicative DNA helicase